MGYFKTSLGIESPEAGNSPTITGDLKKITEQVNALLLKQLTSLVELAKLKVTEKLEVVALKVTGTVELPTGLAFVETGNNYGTVTSRTSGTEYEPSATRTTFVLLKAQQGEDTGYLSMTVTVGGVALPLLTVGSGIPGGGVNEAAIYPFICPPAQKWKCTLGGEAISKATLTSSYLTL